jgi:hypothetical protein
VHKPPPPINENPRTTPGRKNTKKWCRGKVGVEHQPVLVFDSRQAYLAEDCLAFKARVQRWGNALKWCLHVKECAKCGKITEHSVQASECPTILGAS